MNHDIIKDALGELLTKLSLPFSGISVTDEKDITRIDIESAEPSRIIGWHGETLNSIQHLLKSIVRAKENLERQPFLLLDVDGYRRTQEEKVCKIAEAKANIVRRSGNRIALSPMSPYFRRIVHMHIANTPELSDLTTESVGEGDYRQVVLRLKDEKKRTADDQELSPVMSSEDDGLENLDI